MRAEPNETTEKLNEPCIAGQPYATDVYPSQDGWIEEETTKVSPSPPAELGHWNSLTFESGRRFRPWGAILGAGALAFSVGPKIFFQIFDTLGLANGEDVLLWNVWALVTLPFAVAAFLIGGIKDTGRIVAWFHR